jgi:hypothetical protein
MSADSIPICICICIWYVVEPNYGFYTTGRESADGGLYCRRFLRAVLNASKEFAMGAIVIRTRYDEGTESAEVATSGGCEADSLVTRIILRPLSALSLDEGSIGSFKLAMHYGYKLRVVTFGTKRRRSLGSVCKHRSMERSGVKCFHCTHVFDLRSGLTRNSNNTAPSIGIIAG